MAIMEVLLRPELPPTGAKRSMLRHMCLLLMFASLMCLFLPCFQSSLGWIQAPRSINADSPNSSEWYTIPVPSWAKMTRGKYGDMLAYRGKIYVTPHDTTEFMILDTTTNVISVIPTDSFVDKTDNCHWVGITQHEGKIYCAPCNAYQMLVYDTNSMSLSGVPTAYAWVPWLLHGGIPTAFYKWCGIAAWKGKVYAAPFNAEVLLVYDIAKKKVGGVVTSAICHGYGKWIGMVAHDGKLYAAPTSAETELGKVCNQMLVYDTKSGKVSGISTASFATGPWKWHGAAVFNNKIYAVPHCAPVILIYDPESGELSGVSTEHVAKGNYKWSDFAVYGGKIYGSPHQVDEILVFDPQTRAVSGISVKAAYAAESAAFFRHHQLHKKDKLFAAWLGVVGWGGKLYFSPFDAGTFLVYKLLAVL